MTFSRRAILLAATGAALQAQTAAAREAELKRLVKKYGDTYVGSVTYDPDKKLAYADVRRNSKAAEREQNSKAIDGATAATIMDRGKFGLGQKSEMYFFQSVFNDYQANNLQKKKIVFPAKISLEVIVKHECTHAEMNAKGAKIGAITLTSNNWPALGPTIGVLAHEYVAYMGGVNFFRGSPSHFAIAAIDLGHYGQRFTQTVSGLSTVNDFEYLVLEAIQNELRTVQNDVNNVLKSL
jgi:hypothetical protein